MNIDKLFRKTVALCVASVVAWHAPMARAQDTRESHAAVTAVKYVADIEGFGFDTCTRIGYGGMVMVSACPVVLFRNGDALTKVEALNDPQGLAAHKAANARYWTSWRRNGSTIQLNKSGGWKDLGFTAVYSALPKGFTLDGRFRAVNGTGTAAIGGGQAVVAWSDYVFSPDGIVRRDGGAGASTSGGGVSVTTGSSSPGKSGRYRIDGLVLSIDYNDGSREQRVIIADPKDGGRGALWLDGEGYALRK